MSNCRHLILDRHPRRGRSNWWIVFIALGMIGFADLAIADALPVVTVVEQEGSTQYSLTLQLLALMTLLSLLPALLLGMTSFIRIIIVLSLLRQALGTMQTPPNQVLLGIALFLTFFVMGPVFTSVYDTALAPYLNEEISIEAAVAAAEIPVRGFMSVSYTHLTLPTTPYV